MQKVNAEWDKVPENPVFIESNQSTEVNDLSTEM